MAEALRFFQEYETILYFVLGIGVISYGWRFWGAWQELRGSIYGLEQLNAQRRLNQSAISIFILLVMGFVVFSLVTFISPVITPEYVLGIGTNTPSTEVTSPDELLATVVPDNPTEEAVLPSATPLPTVDINPNNCIPSKINITSPEPDEEVRGIITVEGIVNVEDFGFYKFELAQAHEEIWKAIQVFKSQVFEEGPLYEDWDTSIWPPGSYVIQIVVTKRDGDACPPCRIPIRIGSAP
jgi:hypothetical protein